VDIASWCRYCRLYHPGKAEVDPAAVTSLEQRNPRSPDLQPFHHPAIHRQIAAGSPLFINSPLYIAF
jgi:hypothetical protein